MTDVGNDLYGWPTNIGFNISPLNESGLWDRETDKMNWIFFFSLSKDGIIELC